MAGFDDDFTGQTLRVDYHHSGTATEEHFSLDRTRIEGPWPGSRTQMLDGGGLGKYRVEVTDIKTQRVLYSRGFASIYGEWETTGDARETFRTIEEAVRVPEPRGPFQLAIRKRGAGDAFREIWNITIDPASRFVDRAPLESRGVFTILDNGSPATKVDLLFLGDGYTADESADFRAAAKRLTDALFREEPFKSRKGDFNVRGVDSPAAESGVSRPRAGVFRDSPLGTRYNSFDSERYVLTLADRKWRDIAASAPYDAVVILVNEHKYGGGGIFNLYSTAAAGSGFSPYLVVHEFGHHFAGLGDEYYTSPVAYEEFSGQLVEPWEANITALADPKALKWADLADEDTPLPTPWTKETYETKSRASQKRRAELRAHGAAEAELEALFRDEQQLFTKMLSKDTHSGEIGAFEGAMYQAQGLYRPAIDCLMFTRNDVGFCSVCRRAIDRVIDQYAH
jgi:hypothetical protein